MNNLSEKRMMDKNSVFVSDILPSLFFLSVFISNLANRSGNTKMAKKRKVIQNRRPISKVGSNWGYYLFRESGLSVAYAGKANEDGSMDAALFGIDTWRDGLIACYGRDFETKESFEEVMQSRDELIKPSTKAICQEEIAFGLRIRITANASLPTEFERWKYLVDPLDAVRLPPYLYRCPECGRGLPEHYIQQIFDGVDGETIFYMLCDRCSSNRSPIRKSPQYAAIMHGELFYAFKELDGFSVTWYRDHVETLIKVPVNPEIIGAIRTIISEGDAMQAACLAIETYIACSSVPNRDVTDKHIFDALKIVSKDEVQEYGDDTYSEIVGFLVDAIEGGIDIFSEASLFRSGLSDYINSALQWTMKSVENHRSNSDPRSYIHFINRFIRV
jgi:hypothetical protein